jgi:hypothetical protein
MRDGHSSGTPVTRRLEQPTRAADPDRSGPSSCEDKPAPLLFGLAPGGVCRAGSVAGPAVRSYRTVSPLPSSAEAGRRSVLCGTVPEARPTLSWRQAPPDVIRHRLSMEPGLSSAAAFRLLLQRPSGRLTLVPMGSGRHEVKRGTPRRLPRRVAKGCDSQDPAAYRARPPASCGLKRRPRRRHGRDGSGAGTQRRHCA